MIERRVRYFAGLGLGAARAVYRKLRDRLRMEQTLDRAERRATAAARPVLANQRVLITGSTRGIGRALAEGFVRQGASVAVHGRREAEAQECALELAKLRSAPGPGVLGFGADLAEVGAGRTLVERAVRGLGGLDLVINNAAIHDPRRKPFWETPSEEVLTILKVNVVGAFDVAAAALASMREQGVAGRIINISTGAANPENVSGSGIASYGISKFGLEGLSHYLAAESQDVTVVTLRPGTIDTDMVASLFSLDERWRMLRPDSMVPLVFHLASAPREEVHGRVFEQPTLMQQLGAAVATAAAAKPSSDDTSAFVSGA